MPEVEELLGRVGSVVRLAERLMDAATAVSGVAPAYVALIAEAWIDAAVGQGIPAAQAAELVADSLPARPRCCSPTTWTRSRCGAP